MTPQERRTTIVGLLDHWPDFYDHPSPTGDSRPDGCTIHTPVPLPDCPACAKAAVSAADWSLFSSMSRWPSVVELRRCVELCARMAPQHYRHLMAYTARVEWRLVDKPIKRRDAHGRWVDDTERTRERVVPGWVAPRMVDRALDFVLGVWNGEVPVELPPALCLKLRALADAEGWTEAA